MKEPGHIYVLINPSMEGLVKVGKTTRDPDSRAKELSQATGVPVPFYVAFSIQVEDCHSAEEYVHAVLEHNGFKRSANREFFQMPLRQAIEVLMLVQTKLQEDSVGMETATVKAGQKSPEAEGTSSNKQPSKEQHPGRLIFIEGVKTLYGYGDSIKDEKEGVRLLHKAKALTFPAAYTALAEFYAPLFMPNQESDYDKAFEILKEGAQKGHGRCYIKMAELYCDRRDYQNANKCWKKYFQSQTFLNDDDKRWTSDIGESIGTLDGGWSRIEHICVHFIPLCAGGVLQFDADFFEILLPFREQIISKLKMYIVRDVRADNLLSKSGRTPSAGEAKRNEESLASHRKQLHFVEENFR